MIKLEKTLKNPKMAARFARRQGGVPLTLQGGRGYHPFPPFGEPWLYVIQCRLQQLRDIIIKHQAIAHCVSANVWSIN